MLHRTTYRYDGLEKIILAALVRFGSMQPDLFNKNTSENSSKIASLLDTKAGKQRHIDNLLAAFADMATKQSAVKIQELEQEIEQIDIEIASLKQEEMQRRGDTQLNHIGQIRELYARIYQEGGYDLYLSRAKVAQALNGLIDFISFDPIHNMIAVMYKGGGFFFMITVTTDRDYECSDLLFDDRYTYDKERGYKVLINRLMAEEEYMQARGEKRSPKGSNQG